MAVALDAVGTALGALDMLAFAVVRLDDGAKQHIASAFIGASLAWLFVAVAAWNLRRQMPFGEKRQKLGKR